MSRRSIRDRAASTAVAFLLLPALAMLAVGVAVNGLTTTSVSVLAVGAVGLAVMVMSARRTVVCLTCDAEHINFGLVPFWRTRLRSTEVAGVALVRVDAFAEYGGWGIRGRAGSERGRLYSAGGTHAVRLRTHDRRSFVIAFPDRGEAERARAAVAAVMNPSQR